MADGIRCRRVYCEACEYHNAVITEVIVAGQRFATLGCPECKFSKFLADDMCPENIGRVWTPSRQRFAP